MVIADTGDHETRKVDMTTNLISLAAGTPQSPAYYGDGGDATSANLNSPTGVDVVSQITDSNPRLCRTASKL
jgi:hypothetical protein